MVIRLREILVILFLSSSFSSTPHLLSSPFFFLGLIALEGASDEFLLWVAPYINMWIEYSHFHLKACYDCFAYLCRRWLFLICLLHKVEKFIGCSRIFRCLHVLSCRLYSIFEKCNDLDHIPKGDTSFEVWVYLSNCEKQSEKRRNANMSEYLIDNGSMGRHIGVS